MSSIAEESQFIRRLEHSEIFIVFPILNKPTLKMPASFQEVEVKSAALSGSVLKSLIAQLRPGSPGVGPAQEV